MVLTSYNHLFHRDSDPFKRIISGEKTFEIRLNDEKRQKVKIGDKIRGVLKGKDDSYFRSEITNLEYFDDWDTLFTRFGDKISSKDKQLLQKIYTPERVVQYSIVIMHFTLLDVHL